LVGESFFFLATVGEYGPLAKPISPKSGEWSRKSQDMSKTSQTNSTLALFGRFGFGIKPNSTLETDHATFQIQEKL